VTSQSLSGVWRLLGIERTVERGSDVWKGVWRVGRFQVGFRLYCHHYDPADRWVVQPYVIYDRKAHASAEGDR
jgi:hypothetical protein